MIIEKAWASVHGSYERIIKGNTCDTIRDLLGAPSKEYPLETDPRIFDRLIDADRKDFIMVATKNKYNQNEPDKIYTVQGVEVVTMIDGKKENLIKIRDYNNSLSFKGDFSKQSNKWTPELKKQVDFDK